MGVYKNGRVEIIANDQQRLAENLKRALQNNPDAQKQGSSLKQIAEATGFFDAFHFSREFKRAVGQSPAVWRIAEWRG